FGGWAANGLALKAAPGLVLLGAAALLIPWGTRRQIYCHQICPHGAAQQLISAVKSSLSKPTAPVTSGASTVSARWLNALEYLPALLLGVALIPLLLGWKLNL